jgi:hypothetical protein
MPPRSVKYKNVILPMVLQIGEILVLQRISHFSPNWDENNAVRRSFTSEYPRFWAHGFAEKLHLK